MPAMVKADINRAIVITTIPIRIYFFDMIFSFLFGFVPPKEGEQIKKDTLVA
jgi:hypothetical protein